MADAKRNADSMSCRFPKGTFKRMERLLFGRELKVDLVRDAVERELRRREAGGGRDDGLDDEF